jgi:hypothetical protein
MPVCGGRLSKHSVLKHIIVIKYDEACLIHLGKLVSENKTSQLYYICNTATYGSPKRSIYPLLFEAHEVCVLARLASSTSDEGLARPGDLAKEWQYGNDMCVRCVCVHACTTNGTRMLPTTYPS